MCPHCKTGARYTLTTSPNINYLRRDNINSFIVNYSCEICLGPIPVRWDISNWPDQNNPNVQNPKEVLPVREPFDFTYVPNEVCVEIEEALDCLSVSAYNGFAALCRRAIQTISTNLGAKAASKVKKQIEEMMDITELGNEWKDLAFQIMLSGHDGSHPNLPDVDVDRASVLLTLLQDLTYELYTRPGKVKEAAQLRQEAIDKKNKEETNG